MPLTNESRDKHSNPILLSLLASILAVSIPLVGTEGALHARPLPIGRSSTNVSSFSEPSLVFIDKRGKQTIKYQFHLARPFSEGLAAVLIDNQWGFIDKSGSVKIGARFDRAQSFSEGLAAVKIKDDWGYIDREGNIVIEPRFVAVEDFKNGRAVVYVAQDSPEFPQNAQKKLQAILADSTTSDLKKALMAIAGSRKAGVIDRAGKFVLEPEYTTIDNFNEDHFLVWKDQQCQFLDGQGKPRFKLELGSARSFSSDMAAVEIKGKWGFINTSGRIVIKPQFEKVKDFDGELAPARLDGKWGFIDKRGNWHIKPKYTFVWEGFQSGVAVVGSDLCPIENDTSEITEYGGNYIYTQKEDRTDEFDESTTPFELSQYSYPDLRFGLIDRDGNEVAPIKFDQIGPLKDGVRAARLDGRFGFVDNFGNIVIKPRYRWVSSFSDDYALVQEGHTKPKVVERNEALLKQPAPSQVNDPGLIEKDIEICDKVIELDPTNAKAFRDRGYLRCARGEFKEAIADFNEVVKLCPLSIEGYYWRGLAHLELEKYRHALIDFTSALEIDKGKQHCYYGRAKALLHLGQHKFAEVDINRAIRLDDHPFYRDLRGRIYEAMGEMDKALPELEAGRRAPALNSWAVAPKSQRQLEADIEKLSAETIKMKESSENKLLTAFTLTRLADEIDDLRRLKQREQKLLELEELFKRSVAVRREAVEFAEGNKDGIGAPVIYKNDLSNSLAQLAGWYTRMHKYEEASDLLKESLQLARSSSSVSKEADCLNDLGKLYMAKDDLAKAQDYFQKSLQLTGDSDSALLKIIRGQTLNSYSTLLRKQKRVIDAKVRMEEASKLLKFGMNLAILPSPPAAPAEARAEELYELALQCKGLGLIETSREYMKQVLEKSESSELKEKARRFLDSQLPRAEVDLRLTKTFQKGRTAEAAGDFPSAELMYRTCLSVNPDFEWSYEGLARLKRLQGELGTADKFIKKALSINPEYMDAWLEQARIYEEKGESQKAKEALKKALNLDPESQLALFEEKYLHID